MGSQEQGSGAEPCERRGVEGTEREAQAQSEPRLLEQVRNVMRLHHLIRLVPTSLTLPGFSCC
jgi:hypothetical protein